MGLLDELLAGAMQGAAGASPRERRTSAAGGADMGRVMMALLPVVLAMLSGGQGGRARGGGLEDALGQMMGGGAPRAGAGGGLGDLLGQVLGGGAGGGGGLGDLLGQLQRAGFGEQARSWVGTGANQPIGPDAIEAIFGRAGLASIARQAGVSEADASRGLADLLPEVVDRVTPGGEVPDFDQLTASVESLARQLRG
ncbi:MAG: YidB family protein [Burkholderiales bacterium]|nr:YidB family protein [Burkholderiales bacterium]